MARIVSYSVVEGDDFLWKVYQKLYYSTDTRSVESQRPETPIPVSMPQPDIINVDIGRTEFDPTNHIPAWHLNPLHFLLIFQVSFLTSSNKMCQESQKIVLDLINQYSSKFGYPPPASASGTQIAN